MNKAFVLILSLLFTGVTSLGQVSKNNTGDGTKPLRFIKKQIAAESFESVDVFDVNNDKIPDIVSGAYWYEGPAFLNRHFIGAMKRVGEYWDDFSTVPLDVNGDGRLDFITGGWFGKSIFWWENPGNNQEWKQHLIAETGNVETTRSWDIDQDGVPEIVPNTPNDPLVIYRLNKEAQGKETGTFTRFEILRNKQDHGLGFGDINNDGRGDFILSKGWVEAPKNYYKEPWIFHPAFDLGTASVPILVADVNKDGLNDIIVGQGHGYGLDWYEQTKDKKNKASAWKKHPIDPFDSQFHTMQWIDLDGDGEDELITGKRYRAHNGNDPGSNDPVGIYYYKWNGEGFTKQIISYGPFGEGKGLGIYFSVKDLTGSGRKDIIVAGKDGLYVFYNQGYE